MSNSHGTDSFLAAYCAQGGMLYAVEHQYSQHSLVGGGFALAIHDWAILRNGCALVWKTRLLFLEERIPIHKRSA